MSWPFQSSGLDYGIGRDLNPTPRFNSLYESLSPLTGIINQHFVEWFSGSGLSSIWTSTNNNGAMSDAVDGGYLIKHNGVGSYGEMSFNNRCQYSHNSSVFIANMQRTTVTVFYGGFADLLVASTVNQAWYYDRSDVANKSLVTADGVTQSTTQSAIANTTTMTGVKLELGSADVKLYIDGVLAITKTTNRPSVKMQPHIWTTDAVTGQRITYMECYNTTVSILSSLYERLSVITQLLGQRVVEHFSGSAIQSQRWTTTQIAGTGTAVINDAIDGGLIITTGATDDNETSINFNNKRQYNQADSVCILVASAIANSRFRGGFSENTDMSNSFALVEMDADNTNYKLATDDGATETSTDTSPAVAIDTSYHMHKIVCGSADITLYVDGILEVTKTTNRPDTIQQPFFSVKARSTGAKTGNIRYIEAYNKLAVETIYPSVYELFSKIETVQKQHFWEWFSGNAIDTTRWTFTNIAGTGSGAIENVADEGYQITTGATDDNESGINFNDKRQYSNTAASVIAVCKRDTTSRARVGFSENTDMSNSFALCDNDFDTTNYRLSTDDGSTETSTDTGSPIAVDTSYHIHKITTRPTDVLLYIDGILEVTKTTNLPDASQQPFFAIKARSAGAKTGNIRYIEAKNT